MDGADKPEDRPEQKFPCLMPQDPAPEECARPASQQGERMQGGFRNPSAALLCPAFIPRIGDEGYQADGSVNRPDPNGGHFFFLPDAAWARSLRRAR